MGAVVNVRLNGGPHDGKSIKYYQPLPETLCISRGLGTGIGAEYHDYKRRDAESNPPHNYDWVGKSSDQTRRIQRQRRKT